MGRTAKARAEGEAMTAEAFGVCVVALLLVWTLRVYRREQRGWQQKCEQLVAMAWRRPTKCERN